MLETISQKSLNLLKTFLLVSFKVILTALACYAGYYVLFIYVLAPISHYIAHDFLWEYALGSLFISIYLFIPGLIYLLIFSRQKVALEAFMTNIIFCSLNFFDEHFTINHFLAISILSIIFTTLILFVQFLILRKKYASALLLMLFTSSCFCLTIYLTLFPSSGSVTS